MKILPHRYPLLLIDRILELEPGVRALGYKNVTVNEPFFAGHFPGNPVMPGIYMIEAMAQLGGTTVIESGDIARKVSYLAAIEKAKFRRPVIPGDRLMMEAIVLRQRGNIAWLSVKASVEDVTVANADMTFSIVTDESAFAMDASLLHL